MKKRLTFASLFALAALTACAATATPAPEPAPEAELDPAPDSLTEAVLRGEVEGAPLPLVEPDISGKAEAIAALLAGEEFSEVHERFGKVLQSTLPLSQLSRSWQSVVREAGEFLVAEIARVEDLGEYEIVWINALFSSANVSIQLTFDQNMAVQGIFFRPEPFEAATASPPPYAEPGTFDEHEVLVGEGPLALPGTLTLPVSPGPVPAVVLVHGSGPNDRDSSLGPNKPFRDLAWGLASRGVAVLRYEKRTRQHPSAFAALGESYTVREEVIDDALAAVASLRTASEASIGEVYVLGHSLGGSLAPRIADQDASIAGVIMLAPFSRPFEELMLYQVEYIAGLCESCVDEVSMRTLREQVARVRSPARRIAATAPRSAPPSRVASSGAARGPVRSAGS